MIRHRIIKTRWGCCGLVVGARGLVRTFLPAPSEETIARGVRRLFPRSEEDRSLMPKLVQSIQAYFEGKPVRLDARLDLEGIPNFRRRVMEACRGIPPGTTTTYADLARAAGSPRAARAAGCAMANNPLPLIVPCHRVVRADGSLGGFSSPQGFSLKRRLLRLEGASVW